MRSSRPPATANSLLERFRVDEGLIGDLAEEGRHRSTAWFWRQTAVALVKTSTADVHAHKGLAVRAVVVGWILQILGALLIGRQRMISQTWLNAHPGFPVMPPLLMVTLVVEACLIGWVVARLHRPHSLAMLLVFMTSFFLVELGGGAMQGGSLPGSAYSVAFHICFALIVMPGFMMLGGLLSTSEVRPKPDATYNRSDVLF